MPVAVTQPDIEAALVRPLTATEESYVGELAGQAIAKLRAAIRGIDARVAAYEADPEAPNGIDPDLVTAVLAGVIKRVVVNSKGAWSETRSTGPYSTSVTYAGDRGGNAGVQAPGVLAILPSDIEQIVGSSPFTTPGTIRTRPRHCEPRGHW